MLAKINSYSGTTIDWYSVDSQRAYTQNLAVEGPHWEYASKIVSYSFNEYGYRTENLDKINWYFLPKNPAALHIIEKNQDKMNYPILSENPAIFVLDREAMREQINNGFAEELIASALHPRHFTRNLIQYNYHIGIDEYME